MQFSRVMDRWGLCMACRLVQYCLLSIGVGSQSRTGSCRSLGGCTGVLGRDIGLFHRGYFLGRLIWRLRLSVQIGAQAW